MAKKIDEKKPRPGAAGKIFNDILTTKNKIVLAIGLLMILAGFIALGQSPVNGFVSMTLAPILLVLGFVVIVPLGFLLRESKENPQGD